MRRVPTGSSGWLVNMSDAGVNCRRPRHNDRDSNNERGGHVQAWGAIRVTRPYQRIQHGLKFVRRHVIVCTTKRPLQHSRHTRQQRDQHATTQRADNGTPLGCVVNSSPARTSGQVIHPKQERDFVVHRATREICHAGYKLFPLYHAVLLAIKHLKQTLTEHAR